MKQRKNIEKTMKKLDTGSFFYVLINVVGQPN